MNDINGFVLAGGASSRMGQAKAQLRLGGKTFVERAASAFSAVASPERIFIVGNLQEDLFDLPILPDEFVGKNDERRRGSIIGLHTALSNTNANWAAVLACDLPFASGKLFEKLASFRDGNSDAVVPLQGEADKAQPLCALYRRESCLPVLEEMLGEGVWKLQELLRRVKTRFVEFENLRDLPRAEHFFFNVDTPEDYKEARQIINDRN